MCRKERDTNSPRDHPSGIHILSSDYYIVRYLDNEVADVFLFPEGRVYDIEDGRHEYDVTAFLLHGVHVWPGLEGFVRANFQMLCEIGELLY